MPQRTDPRRLGRTRRELVRAGAGVGAATVTIGPWVAGCGRAAGNKAHPSAVAVTTRLTAAISYQGATNYSGVQRTLVQDYIAKHWSAKHRGVEVSTVPSASANGTHGSAIAMIAAAVAGTGMDIVSAGGWQLADVLAGGFLRPLDSFVRKDNLSLTGFDPGQLRELTRPVDGGLMGLPAYSGPMVLLVNYSLLDQFGLARPQPDWTHTEAAALWQSISRVVKGKRLYGAGLDSGDPAWQLATYGASVASPNGQVCTVDSTAAVRAMTWMRGLVASNAVDPGGNGGSVRHRRAVFGMTGGWSVQTDAFHMHTLGVKWDWLPMPTFPAGRRATYVNGDWYGINANSKNSPDLVWSLFRFLTTDPGLWQLLFRTTFAGPNLRSLWPDWLQVVRAVDPVLRTKHLEYYAEAMAYGVPNYRFPYEPAQCDTILNQYRSQIIHGKVSPTLGLQQAAKQINAIQAAGSKLLPALAQRQRAVRAALAKAAGHPTAARFTAPPRSGYGAAPAAATKLVRYTSGALTLTASGADALNNGGDACTFMAAALTAATATFICRVTGLADLRGVRLAKSARVGLMARGDLSGNAPAVAIEVTAGNGIHLQYRPVANTHVQGFGPAKTSVGGLLTPATYSTPNPAVGKNALVRPVWIRLQRDLDHWTASTSLDGASWKTAGPTATLQMAGCWVGVFATAHTSSGKLTPSDQVRGTADHLKGFTPNTPVSLVASNAP